MQTLLPKDDFVMDANTWSDFCVKYTTAEVRHSAALPAGGLPPVHCTAFYIGKVTATERDRIVQEALPLWDSICTFSTYTGQFEPMGSFCDNDCFFAAKVDIEEDLFKRILAVRKSFYEKLRAMGLDGVPDPEARTWNPHLTLFGYANAALMNHHLEHTLAGIENDETVCPRMMIFEKPVLAYRDEQRNVHHIPIPPVRGG